MQLKIISLKGLRSGIGNGENMTFHYFDPKHAFISKKGFETKEECECRIIEMIILGNKKAVNLRVCGNSD